MAVCSERKRFNKIMTSFRLKLVNDYLFSNVSSAKLFCYTALSIWEICAKFLLCNCYTVLCRITRKFQRRATNYDFDCLSILNQFLGASETPMDLPMLYIVVFKLNISSNYYTWSRLMIYLPSQLETSCHERWV